MREFDDNISTHDLASKITADSQRNLSHRTRALLTTIDFLEDHNGAKIGLASCFRDHLGLSLRKAETLHLIGRVAARYFANWNDSDQELMVPREYVASGPRIVLDLADRLALVAWRPLTPRLLLTALKISAHRGSDAGSEGKCGVFGPDLFGLACADVGRLARHPVRVAERGYGLLRPSQNARSRFAPDCGMACRHKDMFMWLDRCLNRRPNGAVEVLHTASGVELRGKPVRRRSCPRNCKWRVVVHLCHWGSPREGRTTA